MQITTVVSKGNYKILSSYLSFCQPDLSYCNVAMLIYSGWLKEYPANFALHSYNIVGLTIDSFF